MTQRQWGTAHIPSSVSTVSSGFKREVKWECVDQGLDYAIKERKAHRQESKTGTMCSVSFDHVYREVVAIVEAGRAAWAYEEVQNKAKKYVDIALVEDAPELHSTEAVADGWEDFELFMKRIRNLTSYLESEWINNHKGAIDNLFISSRCLWFDVLLSETQTGKSIQDYLIDSCHAVINDTAQPSGVWTLYTRLMTLIKTLDVRRYTKFFAKPFKLKVLSDFSDLFQRSSYSTLEEYVNFLCSTLTRLTDHLTKVQIPETTVRDVRLSILSSVFEPKKYCGELFEAAVKKRSINPIIKLMDYSKEVRESNFVSQLFKQVLSITTNTTLKETVEETSESNPDDNSTVKSIVGYLQFIKNLGIHFSHEQQELLNTECFKTINQDQDLTVKAMTTYLDTSVKQAQKKDSLEYIENAWKMFADIYQAVESKDMIEDLTRIKLSSRLIEIGKNVTDMKLAIETEIIRLFKLTATNSNSVRQMEEMVKDICTSTEDLEKYKDQKKNLLDSDSAKTGSFLVLKPSCWPAFKLLSVRLASSLDDQLKMFTNYYFDGHKKRVLTWHHSLGSINLIAIINKRRHTISGPLLDGSILLSNYQTNDEQTVSQICETYDSGQATDESELKKSVARLIWNRILLVEGTIPTNMAKMMECLLPDVILKLNMKPPQKINIKRKAGAVVPAAKSNSNNAARNAVVDASIVRIMKSRKTATFTDLLEQIIQQVQCRFKPEVSFIKRRIENLIDRGFITRKEGDINSFTYQG